MMTTMVYLSKCLVNSKEENKIFMKKRISILLMLALLSTLFSVISVQADTNLTSEPNSSAVQFVIKLGLIDSNAEGFFESDKAVTRAEFCVILTHVLGIDINKTADTSIFVDVMPAMPEKNAIAEISKRGLMVGTEENIFEPQKQITVAEAIKVLLHIIGYDNIADIKGGYPNGYIFVANDLKLINGISTDSGLTQDAFAEILYSMRNVKVIKVNSISDDSVKYSSDNDNTFMTEIMQIGEVKGRLTDNGYTSLSGESSVGENYIMIENNKFSLTENTNYIRDLIGQNLILYYDKSKKTELIPKVICALPDEEDMEEFDFMDSSYKGQKFEYDNGNKIKNLTITKSPYVIFNGKAYGEIKAEFFDYEFGTVKLIKDQSSAYDIVIIEAWANAMITAVDYENRVIYLDKNNQYTDKLPDKLDINDYRNTDIRDVNGNQLDFDKITHSSVIDICFSSKNLKITVPEKCITNVKITSKNDKELISDTKTYPASAKYLSSDKTYIPKIGESCDIYINKYGYVVWIESALAYASDSQVGYLIKIARSDEIGGYGLRILTTSGTIVNYKTNDKVKFISSDGLTAILKNDNIYSVLLAQYNKGIIQYNTNDEAKIIEVRAPLLSTVKNKGDTYLHTICDKITSRFAQNNFGGKVITDIASKLFLVNENVANIAEEDEYYIEKVSYLIEADVDYTYSAYSFGENSPYGQYIVIHDYGVKADPIISSAFLVNNVAKTLNDYDESVIKVSGQIIYNNSPAKNAEFWGETDLFDKAPDTTQSGAVYKIEPGDIIRYYAKGNEIKTVELLYRSNAVNPSGRKGVLAGSVGIYNGGRNGNPFSLEQSTIIKDFILVKKRFVMASVLNVDEYGNITYTSQDLTAGAQYNKDDQNYITESFRPRNFDLMNMVKYGDKPYVTRAYLDDIRTYYKDGQNCSRLLLLGSCKTPM